ncbi:hypothetical protein ZOSMA_376G00150 [Zostera marina]|uniref:DEUBAD domain-containing protein n=1 Tax=Zostera marina TaxID=29655 RepID=A0A0K9P7U1_ZOSMR|nr:hypothetical protein ZOSMA_376G00150 [Zostera marina]
MAILENRSYRDSRLVADGDFPPKASGNDGCTISSYSERSDGVGENLGTENMSSEVDSGMESDDYDYSELGESGSEFCQVGNQSCIIPYELYDIPDLKEVLSLDTWNNCLTEDERFGLTQYLPDMDDHTFYQTMNELLSGENFHFSSPIVKIFDMLKGGICEPRVVLYRQELNFLQRCEHYHHLQKYQNNMVTYLSMASGLWNSLTRYGIEEKLKLLKASTDQRISKCVDGVHAGSETNSEDKDADDLFWQKRHNADSHALCRTSPPFEDFPQSIEIPINSNKVVKRKSKGIMKFSSSNGHRLKKNYIHPDFRSQQPFSSHAVGGKTRNSNPSSRYKFSGKGRINDYLNDYNGDIGVDKRDLLLHASSKPGKKKEISKPKRHDSRDVFIRKETPVYHDLHMATGKKNGIKSAAGTSYDPYSDIKSRHFERDWTDSKNENFIDVPAENLSKKQKKIVQPDTNGHINMFLSGCKSVTKKRKLKAEVKAFEGQPECNEYTQSIPDKPTDEIFGLKKKGKRKTNLNHDIITLEHEVIETEPEPQPQSARKPFTLITPTNHTSFSFSVVHLLSAVRKAMITVNAEDAPITCNQISKENGVRSSQFENLDASFSQELSNMPKLTIQQIINRVRSNPGDPCILETEEPIQELVRGVLKIFSSKTAPSGVKGWKTLVLYEKPTKTWTWIGPISPSSAYSVEEENSAEAWDIPHKMLVKLVDVFANWLKCGQEFLKKIGSLPPPPSFADFEKSHTRERFRDLRAQKSLVTISPSSDEVRDYFRKEEFLRYQVPDRIFSYTAADGKKSVVAPLRRGGGKPTSKARDHFMLKPDRPPNVTILCLVRDAASRLPGSIGTRIDVCSLIRDSQYIMEDVSDSQVNQVVSGALDRLHYERDPCVQYDNERKLWVYLHQDREEEDFEDDGTSSTKKWKKPRKDGVDNSDMVVTETNCNANENQNRIPVDFASVGYDIVDPATTGTGSSSINPGMIPELFCGDLRPNIENIENFIDSSIQGGGSQEHPMGWEVLNSNSLHENRIVCQENSRNDDLGDEAFGRGRLFNARLL